MEQERAERICRAIGIESEKTTELWVTAVELNDALCRYQSVERELREAASSVGIADEQWQDIRRGRATTG
jgi:hypothetical protein